MLKPNEKVLEASTNKIMIENIPSPSSDNNNLIFNPMYCSYNEKKDKYSPKAMIENIEALLNYYNVDCKYNQLTKDVEIDITQDMTIYNTTENIYDLCMQWVYNKCIHHNFLNITIQKVQSILLSIANRNAYNPVKDYLEDVFIKYNKEINESGYIHIKKLCDTIICAEDFDNKLKKILISRWLVGAVACAFELEGARLEGVLTLQGGQSIGKTTWLRSLSPYSKWQKDGLDLDPSDKDSIKKATKYWMVELGEIGSTFKRDFNKLKAFITQDADEYRPPYALKERRFPRRTTFAGSVNEETFLKDETGNRRWWVLPCVEIKENNVDLDLLWCEAVMLYKSGYKWYLPKEENNLLESYNKNHQIKDSVDSTIEGMFDWESSDRYWLKSSDVFIEIGKPQRTNAVVIGQKLAKLKLETKIKRGIKYYSMPKNKKAYDWQYPSINGKIKELPF